MWARARVLISTAGGLVLALAVSLGSSAYMTSTVRLSANSKSGGGTEVTITESQRGWRRIY